MGLKLFGPQRVDPSFHTSDRIQPSHREGWESLSPQTGKEELCHLWISFTQYSETPVGVCHHEPRPSILHHQSMLLSRRNVHRVSVVQPWTDSGAYCTDTNDTQTHVWWGNVIAAFDVNSSTALGMVVHVVCWNHVRASPRTSCLASCRPWRATGIAVNQVLRDSLNPSHRNCPSVPWEVCTASA